MTGKFVRAFLSANSYQQGCENLQEEDSAEQDQAAPRLGEVC
jgi:hypothetical protein